MSRRKTETEKMLHELLPAPSAEQVESAGERVLRRLQLEADRLPAPANLRIPAARVPKLYTAAGVVAACVIVFAILARTSIIRTFTPTAPPDLVRTNTHASTLDLQDGSRIEMRAGSQVSLESAADGVRIRLNAGSIIVTAAKQHGHLYVQTKDITVAVVGTVFLVNAEQEGSRVAVIEGTVDVQQGRISKTLMRGEQTASNPDMAPVSVVKEIAWSSNAPSHVARLQQPVPRESPIQKVAPPTPQFEITSIKPEAPVTQDTQLSGDISGFSCHGTDGIRRSPIGQLPSIAAQGRCTGRYTSLPVLVGFAYDVHPRRVRGVPAWRPRGKPIDTGFQIDAKAEDPSMATVADLKQMLKAMLADRFKLEIHRETTECSGYVLSVSPNGLKMPEARPEDEAPPFRTPGGGKEVLKGKSTMASFANLLTDSVGVPVADRTSLAGVYDIVLTLNRVFVSPLPSTGGPSRDVPGFAERNGNICGGEGPRVRPKGAQNQSGQIADVVGYDPPVTNAVEDQLGLHMESAKVPVETIVIDRVERPSSN